MSLDADNKTDVTKTMWTDPRDDDKPGEVVSLDGSDPGPNAFANEGSDSNRRTARAGNGESLPPWVG